MFASGLQMMQICRVESGSVIFVDKSGEMIGFYLADTADQ